VLVKLFAFGNGGSTGRMMPAARRGW
jgi:hypothetical protein